MTDMCVSPEHRLHTLNLIQRPSQKAGNMLCTGNKVVMSCHHDFQSLHFFDPRDPATVSFLQSRCGSSRWVESRFMVCSENPEYVILLEDGSTTVRIPRIHLCCLLCCCGGKQDIASGMLFWHLGDGERKNACRVMNLTPFYKPFQMKINIMKSYCMTVGLLFHKEGVSLNHNNLRRP